jgi:HK97 family phage major capsid protein
MAENTAIEEKVTKYFDTKFDELKASNIAGVEKIKKEFDEKLHANIEDLKKERSFTPAAGKDTDKYANVKMFRDMVKGDITLPTKEGWSPDLIRGLAGFAKASYMREHNIGGMDDAVAKAMGETSGAIGGFFVPIEFKPELLRLTIEGQVVRPRSTVIPMATDTMWIPRIRDTSHVGSIHGGVAGTWTAESTTLTQNEPKAGQVQLIPKKFSDYILVANELIMDSAIAIPSLLGVLLREGLGFFEDVSAISGNGAGQMLGYQSSPALISVTRNTTGHLKYQDIVNMYSRMFPASVNRAVWVCSPACFVDLAQMALAVGTGGSAVWITNYTTASGAPPATIFGRPLIISEKVPTLGTANDLTFCDFSYYLIGDRMQMSLTTSEHVAFAADQTAFRIIERLDGQPWIDSALTPNNGGATLSAFVGLAA